MATEMSALGFRLSDSIHKRNFFFLKLMMKFGMKNPYELKKVVFSPELLKNKALDMRTVRGQFDHYVEKMRLLVGDLEALWQNDIQSSFIAELENIHSSLLDFSCLVDSYASLLNFAAQELLLNPIDLDQSTVASEENSAPVPMVFSAEPELKRSRDNLEGNERFGIPSTKAEADKDFLFYIFRLLSKFGVKNPYEKQKAQLTPQSLKNRAVEMRSIITQYDFYGRKLQYMIEDLELLWCNDIQTSIISQLQDMESAVKDFSNLADEYASLLELAAQELATSNVEIDKTSILTDSPDGPVTVVLANIPYLKRSRMDMKAFDPYFERTQAGVATDIATSRKNSEYLYNIFEDHIELVKYIGFKRTLEIPGEIDGLPVTHIGLDCFALAWRVKFISITMPDSVTTVLHGAFRSCQFIRELKLSSNLRYIGNYAFAFLTALDHIELPENVVSFGMGAFRNCVNLKSLVIPKSTLLRIGSDCFLGCKNLENVIIGNDVLDIEGWAFKTCEHLSSVTMGEKVMNIGESAFYNCIRLMRLDVPETVTNIGDAAFYSRRGITLGVAEGSTAEKYAIDHQLKVVHI